MAGSGDRTLPALTAADFAPGQAHVAQPFDNGNILAIVQRTDPVLQELSTMSFSDGVVRVFVHGSEEANVFLNGSTRAGFATAGQSVATHQIPASVVAQLLQSQFGTQLNGMNVQMMTCYGTLVRVGETQTTVGTLAALLPNTSLQGYNGLVLVVGGQVRLGYLVQWDPIQKTPVWIDPPTRGQFAPVVP